MSELFVQDHVERMKPIGRLSLFLACLALWAVASPDASAQQLSSCPKPSGGRTFIVYLDEIYHEDPAAAGAARVSMNRLKYRLDSQLDSFIEDASLRPEIILCTGRKPSGESDFNREQVDALNVQNVVLEIWGRMEGVANDQVILMGYAVIPLRFYEHFEKGSASVRGVYVNEVGLGTGSAIDVLERNSDLRAYSLLGIGVKSLRVKQYGAALSAFCKASLHLSEGPPSTWSADRKALIQHAQLMALETVNVARKDKDYRGSILAQPADVTAATVCPGR